MTCFATLLTGVMANSGYRWTLRRDMGAWVREMRRFPGIVGVNAAFDPEQSDTDHAFWVHVTHGDETAAIYCCKYWVTGDLIEDFRWGLPWYRDGFATPRALHPIDLKIYGTIGYHGGFYVAPSHRKQGLSRVIPRLVRAISIERGADGIDSEIAYHAGHVLEDSAKSRFLRGAYGYPRVLPCFKTAIDIPFLRSPRGLYLQLITRAEIIDQIEADTAKLNEHDKLIAVLDRKDAPQIAVHRHAG